MSYITTIFKRRARKAAAVVSAAAMLFTCASPVQTASAQTITAAVSSAAAATQMRINYDSRGENNDISNNPAIHLDNSVLADGQTSATITVKLADANGNFVTDDDFIAYEISDPSGSINVTDITPKGVFTSVTLKIDAVDKDGKPLSAGTANIDFSNKTGAAAATLRCFVYKPASDMKVYWNGSSTPLPLNDYSPENSTDVNAIANHNYYLSADILPADSNDSVAWGVYDGIYNGESGVFPGSDKATITSDGTLTTTGEGMVTVVAKFAATSSSPRIYSYGDKIVNEGDKNPLYVKTVPKYIHVNIRKENPATDITFLNDPGAIEVGEKYQLEYELTPSFTGDGFSEATDTIRWSSTDPSVLSVSANGVLTALKPGTSTITLYGDNPSVYAAATIRVVNIADSITISPNPAMTRVSVPIELKATMTPAEADDEIIWESSDPNIAVIEPNDNGIYGSEQTAVLTGVSEGTVTVTATALNSGITDFCEVTVMKRIATDGLTLTYESGSVNPQIIEGGTMFIYTNQDIMVHSALISVEGASPDDTVEWVIENNEEDYITTTSDAPGEMTFHGCSPGTVHVTASSEKDPSVSVSFYITVLKACDFIEFTEADGTAPFPALKNLTVGSVSTIKPKLTVEGHQPLDHADRAVSWTSDAPDIAEVDVNGNVRALKNGDAHITMQTASGKIGVANIHVFTVSSILLTNVEEPGEGELLPHASIIMGATPEGSCILGVNVKDQTGNIINDCDITWSSSDESIATVDKLGYSIAGINFPTVVVGHKVGSATVSVRCGNKSDQCMVNAIGTLTYAAVENFDSQVFSPIKQTYEPRPVVTCYDTQLIENTDYIIEYEKNTEIGIGLMTIKGIGNYTESRSMEFEIKQRPMDDPEIKAAPIDRQKCNGEPQIIKPVITCSGITMKEGVDYSLSYTNNIAPGTATVAVTGIGNYSGAIEIPFELYCDHEDTTETKVTKAATCSEPGTRTTHCNICRQDIVEKIPCIPHTFEDKVIPPTANEEGYTLHLCTVCGFVYNDNYTPKISGTSIRDCTATIAGVEIPYNGEPVTPSVTLRYDGKILTENADYVLIYSNNNAPGTGSITIMGVGNFVDSGKLTFTIVEGDVKPAPDTDREVIMTDDDDTDTDDGRISLTQKEVSLLDPRVFNPAEIPYEPKPQLNIGKNALIENVDYVLEYANNSSVGTATGVIKGIGQYKGVAMFKWEILPKPITDPEVDIRAIAKQKCTGKEVTPPLIIVCDTVYLADRSDYKVTYSNNIKPGVATATVTGIGNFEGTLSLSFVIECEHKYIDQVIAPTYKARGYTLHTCEICGESYKDNYVDQLTSSDLSELSISLQYTSTPYNGEEKTPKVTIRAGNKVLRENSDYKVEYSNNKSMGIANITITGIGGYTGIVTKTFEIVSGIMIGDVNGDSDITADDALITLRSTVGLVGLDATQKSVADVNKDGFVSADDSLAILRYTVGLIQAGSLIGTY